MKVGICDDNEVYLTYLYNLIRQLLSDQSDIICETIPPKAFIGMISQKNFEYDILITDIDLGEANAIDLVQKIQQIDPHCIVIFISSFLKFATDVYDVDHVYFVLKEEIEQRLPKALLKAIHIIKERKCTFLNISFQSKSYRIPLADVIYIEALGRYLYIHTDKEVYKCIRAMKEIMSELNCSFGRCHNSFIVNYNQVKAFKQNGCEMTDGSMISISHTYNKSFMAAYRQYIVSNI